eukprot:EG_transcript_23910
MNKKRYAASKPFRAGSRVTMRLDFDKGTASYEVDGVDLGVVEGLTLPKGPLYPAVLFWGRFLVSYQFTHSADAAGEAEFVPSIPARPDQLAARVSVRPAV